MRKFSERSTAVFAVLVLLAVLSAVLIIVILVRTLIVLVVHSRILRYLY